MSVKAVFLAASGALLLGGCVYRERVVYRQAPPGAPVTTTEQEVVVAGAPPAPLVEEYVLAPGPGFIWIGGAWIWRGHWEWEHGRWARPPHRGAVWMPHHYVNRGGAHVFIRGGWR